MRTEETGKLIFHSAVCSALTDTERNLRLDPFGGEESHKPISIVKSSGTLDDQLNPLRSQAQTFDPDELIGMTYLKDREEDGQRLRAKIVRKIIETDEATEKQCINYLVHVDKADMDEIISYNEVVDMLECQFAE